MSVVLVRIDDRLVHGQVVEGWLKSIRATRLVVASDTVARDETQKALYQLAIPFGTAFECLALDAAARAWQSRAWEKDRVMILVASAVEALDLVQLGAPVASINIGGIHFQEGRVQVLKTVSLDDREAEALMELNRRGVALEVRALPLDEPVAFGPLLERWENRAHG